MDDNLQFLDTLNSFKTSLSQLYKSKTVLLAKREAVRFKYLVSFRQVLESYEQKVINTLNSRNEPLAAKVAERFLLGYLGSVPISKLDGSYIPGGNNTKYSYNIRDLRFGANPALGGGSIVNGGETGVLHPFDSILNSLHIKTYPNNAGMRQTLNKNWETVKFDYWYMDTPTFRSNFPTPVTGQVVYDRSVKPSIHLYSGYSTEQLMAASNIVAEVLKEPMSDLGNLYDVVERARLYFADLVELTGKGLLHQFTVWDTEKKLKDFVDEFKDYLNLNVSFEDLLKSIETMQDAPVNSTVVEVAPTIVAPAVEPVVEVIPEPPKKSNWPIIAAAAAGIFFLTRDK